MNSSATSTTVSIRPSPEVLARLDKLVETVSERTGITARRGGVAMDAFLAGLEVLEKRQGTSPRAKARK